MSGRQAARVIGVGLAPLLPLPWVDGVVRRRILADSFAAEAEAQGVTLDAEALRALTEAEPWKASEKVRGAAQRAGLWPLRRLLGIAPGLLQAKRCVDGTAEAALQVEMVRMALAAGMLPHRAVEVRMGMDAALAGGNHSPLGRALLRTGLGQAPERWGAGEDGLSQALGRVLVAGDGPQVLARFAATLRRAQAPRAG